MSSCALLLLLLYAYLEDPAGGRRLIGQGETAKKSPTDAVSLWENDDDDDLHSPLVQYKHFNRFAPLIVV